MPPSTVSPPASLAVSVPELLGQAGALQQAGQPAKAAALYERWLAATPEAPLRHVVLFNLGTLLSSQQREPDAEAAYREALERQPDFAHALLNLGHVLERRGAHDEALALWQRVIDTRAAPCP